MDAYFTVDELIILQMAVQDRIRYLTEVDSGNSPKVSELVEEARTVYEKVLRCPGK